MTHNKAISGQLSENRYLMSRRSLYIWILLIFFSRGMKSARNGKNLLAEDIVVDVAFARCCSLCFWGLVPHELFRKSSVSRPFLLVRRACGLLRVFLKWWKHPGLLHNGPAAPQVDLILLIDGFPQAVDGHQNSYLVQLLKIAGCNWVKWFFSFFACVCAFVHVVYAFPSVQVIHMFNDVLMVWILHNLFLGPLRIFFALWHYFQDN